MAANKQTVSRNQKVQDVADDEDIVMEEMTGQDMQDAANFLNPSSTAANNNGDNEQNSVADSANEEKGEKDKEKGKPKKKKNVDDDEEQQAEKPKAQKIPKITWTAENDRKLLLIMATAPEKVRGEKNLQVIADFFREKPTTKAIQVRTSKLRELGRLNVDSLAGSQANEQRQGEDGNASVAEACPSSRGQPHPTIDPKARVFSDFPVTWGDLPEEVTKYVKGECEKRKQEMESDARFPAILEMHRRNYAKQLEREAAEVAKQEAAKALLTFSETEVVKPDSDSQAPSERPIPQEERAAKALVSALTGASTSTAGEDEEQDAEREEDGDDAPGGR